MITNTTRWIIGILILCVSGCGFSLKAYTTFDYLKAEAGGNFPRNVLWLPVENQGPYEPEQISMLEKAILKRLKSHKQLVVIQEHESSRLHITFDEKKAKYNIPPELTKKAAQEGAFTAIQVSLLAPTIDVRRAGIWPFRKTKMFVKIGVRVLSVDLTSETVILNKVEKEEVPFYYDPIAEEDPTLYQEALEKAMKSISKQVEISITEAIKETPWVTVVTEVRGELVQVPVGSRHGIKPGNRFAAYEKAEEIKAFDGRRYPIWGKRIGVLEVKEVKEDTSLLSVVSGSGISEGQILRLLR